MFPHFKASMNPFSFKPAYFLLIFAVCMTAIFTPKTALAFDEFDTLHAPPRFTLEYDALTLEIKGRARLGLHDLEGEGGPGYDSPTDTATIGTRSPFVELDSFELAFRLNWQELLWLNTNVSFTTDGASLGAIYFEYQQDLKFWFSHGAEVGYQNSIVATHRHTVRYPLIATQYWKNPEYHAAYGARFTFSKETSLVLYASLSMTRPLKSEPIHGSSTYAGTLKTLSYGAAKAFSGNSVAGTGLIRFTTHGFSAEGFGHIGQIVTKNGINTLISDFPYYRALPEFDAQVNEATAWWAGGRIAYNGYGVHVMAEAIASREQHLRRAGMYAQASYTYTRESDYFNAFEILARYEQTWLLGASDLITDTVSLRTPDLNNAISWDHQIITLAARLDLIEDILSLRLEYHFFLEENGVPALHLDDVPFEDNELLLQVEARY